jgi:prepilin-type N-terminal cleavage/methylation domain-containing protein
MKAFKNMGFGPRKSKSGFTLIELLIVMVILAILAGVVVMAVGGVFGTARGAAYNSVKDDVQNAVTAYATDHQGNFPINTSSGTVNGWSNSSNCTSAAPCYYVNMSALLVSNGGMLRQTPDGTRSVNCWLAGAAGGTCSDANHYTWGATATGIVFSRCDTNSPTSGTATTCTLNGVTSNNSGYQGVWP